MLLNKKVIPLLMGLLLFTSCESPLLDHSYENLNEVFGGHQEVRAPENDDMVYSLEWQVGPSLYEWNSLYFRIKNKNGDFVDFDGEVVSDVWMPSMGHSGGRPLVTEKVNSGEYFVSKISFTMPGDWQVKIILIKNGVQKLVTFDLWL